MFDQHVLELAARQHGVVAAAQLRSEFDISTSAVARARRRGLLIPIAPGVLRIASSPETFDARCVALHLHARGEGYLSGWTAARIQGLRKMPPAPIHLTVPDRGRRDHPEWASVHRSSWYSAADHMSTAEGISVATPLRMLFGLAATFNQFRFERAAEDAWHRGLITPVGAAEYLASHRCRGKDGVSRMERWLEHALTRPRPTQSDLERSLIQSIEQLGLPAPERQFPLELPIGERIHFDIAWPTLRLAVEPGASWWHGGDLAQRRDQARDRACGELGWLVVRFDESMRSDLDQSARQVARIYRRRLNDLRAPNTRNSVAIGAPTHESHRISE